MGLDSSRLPIANALVALLETIQNPTTNLPLFQYVKLGIVTNPGAMTTWCDVTHFQGQGAPAGSGGDNPGIGWRIDDAIRYQITSAVGPYEIDDSAAESNMLALQDILLPELHKYFRLPDAANPTNAVQSLYRVLVDQPDRSSIAKYPNGHVYKLWHVFVIAQQQYNVLLENTF